MFDANLQIILLSLPLLLTMNLVAAERGAATEAERMSGEQLGSRRTTERKRPLVPAPTTAVEVRLAIVFIGDVFLFFMMCGFDCGVVCSDCFFR